MNKQNKTDWNPGTLQSCAHCQVDRYFNDIDKEMIFSIQWRSSLEEAHWIH